MLLDVFRVSSMISLCQGIGCAFRKPERIGFEWCLSPSSAWADDPLLLLLLLLTVPLKGWKSSNICERR